GDRAGSGVVEEIVNPRDRLHVFDSPAGGRSRPIEPGMMGAVRRRRTGSEELFVAIPRGKRLARSSPGGSPDGPYRGSMQTREILKRGKAGTCAASTESIEGRRGTAEIAEHVVAPGTVDSQVRAREREMIGERAVEGLQEDACAWPQGRKRNVTDIGDRLVLDQFDEVASTMA